jgi:hypothetical protein
MNVHFFQNHDVTDGQEKKRSDHGKKNEVEKMNIHNLFFSCPGTTQIMPLSASNAREEENNLLTMLRQWSLVQTKEEPRHLLTTLKKLAYSQQIHGNIDDALDTFHEILQIQESHAVDMQGNTPGAIGLTLRKIADLHGAKGDLNAALASAECSYFAFKNFQAFVQDGDTNHLKAVEEVARSMLVLGGLYNEAWEPLRAQALHEEARLVISAAVCHTAGAPHPILQPLLDACTLQTRSACAPVA